MDGVIKIKDPEDIVHFQDIDGVRMLSRPCGFEIFKNQDLIVMLDPAK